MNTLFPTKRPVVNIVEQHYVNDSGVQALGRFAVLTWEGKTYVRLIEEIATFREKTNSAGIRCEEVILLSDICIYSDSEFAVFQTKKPVISPYYSFDFLVSQPTRAPSNF